MKLKLMTLAIASAFGSFMQNRGLAVGALSVTLDKAEHTKLPDVVKALYVEKDGKFVLDLPEGYEDAKGMKSALQKERERADKEEKARKAVEKQFEGLNADEIRSLLEKMGTDEERKLIKEGNIDEVMKRRTEKLVKAHEKALSDAAKLLEAEKGRSMKYEQQVLDNHVRAAASKAGVHATGIDDALFRARTIFKLDENGNAVQLDAEGKPILGKDGKNPFNPTEWLEGMKETAPHWFPAGSTGGGSLGGGSKGGVKNVKRAEFDKLGPIEKATAARDAAAGKIVIVD